MFRYASMVALLLVQVALAQQFSGSFADPANGVTINLQQAPDGSLQGVLVGPSGQWPLQGNTQQLFAAGVVQSQQGILGFQGQLSQDGQTLQLAFYQMDANGQPVGQGQALTLRRQAGGNPGGAAGGVPGPDGMAGWPPPPAGAVPTNTPPPQMPGGQPSGYPQMPGGQQPGYPQAPIGQQPGYPQMPGGQQSGYPQMPGGQQPGYPQAPIGQQPGFPQAPGGQQPVYPPVYPQGPGATAPQAPTDWNGRFVGNTSGISLMVQGSQGAYTGYLQYQGQQYQFQAHLDEQTLHGAFMAEGYQYEFWADRVGPGAILYVGDSEYELQFAGGL
ncbi:MAG: hypothetical protein ROY82_09810 [Truepera sp.]|nr:hypothetical protein [Truepera sp.]